MKKILKQTLTSTFIALLLPMVVSAQTTFFSDNFTSGSTTNHVSVPGGTPTASFTSYDMAASQAATTNYSIAPHRLTGAFDVAAPTPSGMWEFQAIFTTNPVTLSVVGDYIDMVIVFTNSQNTLLLNSASAIGVGLYNSGAAPGVANTPWPGQLTGVTTALGFGDNTSASAAYASGHCQNWAGYLGRIYNGGQSVIWGRPPQVGGFNNMQELLGGSTTSKGWFQNPQANPKLNGSSSTQPCVLANNGTYTLELKIALYTNTSSLIISNTIYSGVGTGGAVVATNTAITTTIQATSFDALAFGCWQKTTSANPQMDVSSITITGQSTSNTNPPTITSQPLPVSVTSGGSCIFSVAATSPSLIDYQWHRNGTNLTDGGNISGATSSQLVISPAGAADVASGANGYYVTVSQNSQNVIYATNSVTNSLALIAAANLFYSGTGAWDLNTSSSWNITDDGSSGYFFNYGDSVVFDDSGSGGTVTLTGNYLSASSVTVKHTGAPYTWTGTGSFAGSGNLLYSGSGQFNVNNANTFTGGTIISNAAAKLHLGNANGLGTGPVTLAMAGGTMEWTVGGSASAGLGDVNVADDFTMQFDTASTFSGVILGNLSGTTGKTLTLAPNPANTTTNERVRVYGTNLVCNANIAFNAGGNTNISLAPYESSGSQTYNGVISGDGSVWQRGSANATLNGNNIYTGGTYITAGGLGLGINSTPTSGMVTSGPIGTGPLFISPENGSANGSGTVFASGGARTIANALQYPTNNQTIIVGGTNALTFTGPYSLNGNDGLVTNRTFQVNNTNAPTTISGVISDGGTVCGFIKTGVGNLYLDGTNTYTGFTTNNSAAPATNGLGVLAGTGSIAGNVFIQTNSAIGGGDSTGIGTFSISGNLTINGNGWFRVNRSGSASDEVAVGGSINNTGTGNIVVTNLGATLQVGDTFTLFSKAVTGGAALTVTNTGGGIVWSNGLAVNGKISVLSLISSINPNPTNISYTVSGNLLTLSWPADHLGWELAVQTNTLSTGLGNNWVTNYGTASVISTNLTINPANGAVFYKLVHP